MSSSSAGVNKGILRKYDVADDGAERVCQGTEVDQHSLENTAAVPWDYIITKEQLGEKERQECWLTAWKGMREDRIDLVEWQHALSEIPGNNGIEYGGQNEGEPEFIKKVVAVVCGLLRPDVQWDVSHVQSKDSMCKVRMEPSLCCSESFSI